MGQGQAVRVGMGKGDVSAGGHSWQLCRSGLLPPGPGEETQQREAGAVGFTEEGGGQAPAGTQEFLVPRCSR